MSAQTEYAEHVIDLLDVFGRCEAKRMFGGVGIFHQGLMIALIADATLYLKADQQSRAHFEAEGLEAFSYFKQDREYRLSYYQAPEAFFEDSEACRHWARIARDLPLRAPRKGKSKKT